MIGVFNRILLKRYQFLVHQIDGSRYTIYAYNFRDVLRQHAKHFAYDPKLVEPIDNIKGTNAILGSNGFLFDVALKKEIIALSSTDAVKQFQETANLQNLMVEQQYPVWRG